MNKTDSKPKYKFDLRALETKADVAFAAYDKIRNNDTRTDLVLAIKDISYAILKVGHRWKKYDLNEEEAAYEYCVHMFQRIEKGFRPEGKGGKWGVKFPWQAYISLNIMGTVTSMVYVDNKTILKGDLISLLKETREENIEDEISMNRVFDAKMFRDELFSSLKLFYSKTEFNRMFPLAKEIIGAYPAYNVKDGELQQFCSILVALSKRLLANYRLSEYMSTDYKTFTEAFKSAINNSLFLASLDEATDMPKSLFLSCDMESLYRLIMSSGGQTIRIPSSEEFHTLLLSAITFSKCLTSPDEPGKVFEDLREEHGIKNIRKKRVADFVNNVLQSSRSLGEEDPTTPIVHVMVKSMESLLEILTNMADKSNDSSFKECLSSYQEVSKSLNVFTENLTAIYKKEYKNSQQ